MSRAASPLRIEVAVNAASSLRTAFTRDAVLDAATRRPGVLEGVELGFCDTGPALEQALPGADILVLVGQAPLGALRQRAPRLRWLHYTSAGVEWLLQEGLPSDLLLTNASGTHAPKTAEFALLCVLMLGNNMPALFTAQREARWDPRPAPTVAGRTALVLGLGGLGGAAAEALSGAGLTVIGVSRSARPHPAVAESHPIAALPTLLPRADFLVITLPLTPDTHNIIGARELDLLPPGAGVVNIGRGPLLDHDALAARLSDGRLGGAVLDALPQEPLPAESPLWRTPNLIITPHCGLYDPAAYGRRCLDGFFANLERFKAGLEMRQVVDPARGY
ncbi:D-2-hydroxyacid dehydrogenase [Teichococcus oryzae]|uniref:D-2-hydroxyacid dehydrogenase n=1 Tax=Teichococcus oryzae TaxID=1608942 RepID=A0A5B2TJ46_9PROT|nr:D-2-hydroxyacid dehydrogenase [Pseudoroseomonas oryzae]KAA2214199.1 D-2-hydroxyacid dehydrogenase [Pseudoroseomonas oryzae]